VQRVSPAGYACVGLDASAPLELRARVPPGAPARRRLLESLGELAPERLVLHTCERLELLSASGGAPPEAWRRRLAAWLGLPPDRLAPFLVWRTGPGVERHLLRVAAGLESRLPGEPQIQGQVRRALAEAAAAGAIGARLGRLARAALHTGRRVRRETPLGRAPSLVDLALHELRLGLGTLAGRSVLLAGTGALAHELAAALAREGVRLAVASRAPERARRLAHRHGGRPFELARVDAALAESEALVACTDAPLPLPAPAAALPILDLGSPPVVEVTPGLRVTRLEELRARRPAEALEQARRVVEEELGQLRRAARERAAAARVTALLRERRSSSPGPRPTEAERRALHLEIVRLKASAA